MAQNSKIEWTHHTANLWHGCTKVHAGCDNCYAETLSKRWGNDVWGNDKPRKVIKNVFIDLDRYQKLAFTAGEIHRVFVGSMMDIFEKPMPLINSKGDKINDADTGYLRNILFQKIDAGKYNNLMFLLLTKRPSNINKYIPESWKENPPANVFDTGLRRNSPEGNPSIVYALSSRRMEYADVPKPERIEKTTVADYASLLVNSTAAGKRLIQAQMFEESEFVPCDKCDGHDACEDFGCAIELGLGKMLNKKTEDM